MSDEPDYDSFDAHLKSAHKYIEMAHQKLDKLYELRLAGLDAWAEIDGFTVHDHCGLARGWADIAADDLRRMEFLTRRPLHPPKEWSG